MCVWITVVKRGLNQLKFIELILIKIELVPIRFMFGNFYVKSDYNRINIVWIILIKITILCKITKVDMSLYYAFDIIFFDIILSFHFLFSRY